MFCIWETLVEFRVVLIVMVAKAIKWKIGYCTETPSKHDKKAKENYKLNTSSTIERR